MRLLFARSKWESPNPALGEFLSEAKAARFDAAEIYLPELKGKDRDIRSALAWHIHARVGGARAPQVAGPPPYPRWDPATGRPLADPSEVNIWMRDRPRAVFAELA